MNWFDGLLCNLLRRSMNTVCEKGCMISLRRQPHYAYPHSQRQELVQRLHQVKRIHIVDLAPHESLEDAEKSRDLAVGSDDLRPPKQKRLPYPGERWEVSTLLPKCR